MKSEAEVQRAHDMLIAVILGELPTPLNERNKLGLRAACDVLCWVLNHDHNQSFEKNLGLIERLAHANGGTFELGREAA